MGFFKDCKNNFEQCAKSYTECMAYDDGQEGLTAVVENNIVISSNSNDIIYNMYQQNNDNIQNCTEEIETKSKQISKLKNTERPRHYASVIRANNGRGMGPDEYL